MDTKEPKKTFWTSLPVLLGGIAAVIGALATLFTVLNNGKATETPPGPTFPDVSTITVTQITSKTAIVEGIVTSDGGSHVVKRGICWGKIANPTLSDFTLYSGSGIGDFSCSLTGLDPGTKYFANAYAINSIGPSFGKAIEFYTLPELIKKPEIFTLEPTSTTYNSALSGGNIISDGGSMVNERGICFGISPSPTIYNKVENGFGIGSFETYLSGLVPNTIYYIRAYAVTELDTVYGNQVSFITSQEPPSIPEKTTLTLSIPPWSKKKINGAQGSIIYTDQDVGQFICEINVRGLEPLKKYYLTFNGTGSGSHANNNLIKNSFPSKYKIDKYMNNYVDFDSIKTDNLGNALKNISIILIKGQYVLKFYIKEPKPDFNIVLMYEGLTFVVD
jgi:hypothetical protein